MNNFTIETYPPMFSDYDNYIENEDYDDTIRVFSVPKQWAVDWIKHSGYTLDEFLQEYTWDETYEMYEDANSEAVIISEWIEER